MGLRELAASLVAITASLQAVSAQIFSTPAPDGMLRWTGPVHDGQPDTTLDVVDATDLWNKVLKLNPGWTPTPLFSDNQPHYGHRVCGAESGIATGNSGKATPILTKLAYLVGRWTIEGGRCHRLGCGEDVGVYWCNNNPFPISVSGEALYYRADRVLEGCCNAGNAISGVEAFPNDHPEGANSQVAIGFGRCSDNVETVPVAYHYPGRLGACRA